MLNRIIIILSLFLSLFINEIAVDIVFLDQGEHPIEVHLEGDSEHDQKEESKEESKIQVLLDHWQQKSDCLGQFHNWGIYDLDNQGYLMKDSPPPKIVS